MRRILHKLFCRQGFYTKSPTDENGYYQETPQQWYCLKDGSWIGETHLYKVDELSEKENKSIYWRKDNKIEEI